MKRTCLAGAVMMATVILAPVAQAVDLMEKLPEQTLAAFTVRDFTELRQKFEASRYHEAWQSPEMEGLRTTVSEQWAEFSTMAEEEVGIRPDSMLSHFQGAFTAYALFMGVDDAGEVLGSFGMTAEVPQERQAQVRADVEKLLEKAPADATKSMETFRGVDIYRIQFTRQIDIENPDFDLDIDFARPFDIQYAFADDMFFLTEGRNDPLKLVLAARDEDATSTLGRSAGVQAIKSELGDLGDTHVLVNFPQIFAALGQESTGAEAKDVIEKLGLSNIGPAAMSFSLTDFGLLQEIAMPMPREKKGLLAMLDAGDQLQLNTARLAPTDVSTYIAWTLDVKRMWDALYAMVLEFSPDAEGYVGYGFLTANANFEVDVENDIIARIKGEHAMWMKPIPAELSPDAVDGPFGDMPQNPQVVYFGLEEGQQTVDTLNRLFRRLVSDEYGLPLEETEVRGITVWSPSVDIADQLPVQTVVGLSPSGLLVASDMVEMQDVLRRLGGEGTATSMATDPEFQQLYQALPQQWMRMIGYSSPNVYRDLGRQMDAIYFALLMMAEGQLPFEREDIPEANWFLKYFGPSIQAAYVKPEMLRIHQKSYSAK